MTLAEENYLKGIFHLQRETKGEVSTNAIAEDMQTQPSSVTDMIKKLSDKGLLLYKKYKGVQLTELGRQKASLIIRKHRLWEVFLVDKLHFYWDEVHEIAEQLEHVQSDALINRLDAYLGYPNFDPHGDPIPDKNGNWTVREKISLKNAEIGTRYICVGVKNTQQEFLRYLDKKNIQIGVEMIVMNKEFDDSMEIQISDTVIFISSFVAENIYVQEKSDRN